MLHSVGERGNQVSFIAKEPNSFKHALSSQQATINAQGPVSRKSRNFSGAFRVT